MKTPWLFISVLTLACSPALALNDVPASNSGIGWFPYAFQFNDTYNEFRTAMIEQGYDFSYKKDTSHSTHPNCRPQQLIDYCQNGIGKLLVDSHGNTWFFVVASYEKNATGQQQWSSDYNELTGAYGLTLSECQAIIQTTEYIIIFTDNWVANRYAGYNSDNPSGVVWCATCYGHSFHSNWGAHATLTYGYSVPNNVVKTHVDTVMGRLNGKNGTPPTCRILSNAVVGCTNLKLEGNGAWVLAPTVVSIDPPQGRVFHDAGPFGVEVEFDVAMRQDNALDVLKMFSPGYVFEDGWEWHISGPRWSNDHTITGTVVSLSCPGPINPGIKAKHAVSLVGEHQLDGGFQGINNGEGPNRDDYHWEFYTDASQSECDNWATSFGACGAFRENGQTTVYWQVEFQRGSLGYDVYCGTSDIVSYLTSVPAIIIDPDRPAGYSVTVPTDATVFEIYERDDKGNITQSRPFPIGGKPENFAAIVNVGNDYPSLLDLPTRSPNRESGECCAGRVEERTLAPNYIFVSSRQDFLTACQPAISWLESHNRTTVSILTTKNPDDIFWSIEPYY